MKTMELTPARWIWCGQKTGKDAYAAFRNTFFCTAEDLAKAKMEIAADSAFDLRINGKPVPGGQFSDYPHERTVSTLSLSSCLKTGRNEISVLVHHDGESFLTGIAGSPGLIARLSAGEKILSATGSQWKAKIAPGYRSGLCEKLTVQLGFVWAFDATQPESDWQESGFDDSAWPAAVDAPAYERSLSSRPLPLLIEGGPLPVKIMQTGLLHRDKEGTTFAASVQGDWLRPYLPRPLLTLTAKGKYFTLPGKKTEGNGWYILLDLGAERCGYEMIDIDAAAGTVVDIAFGEHLDNGRVHACIAERNFTDRFVAKEGINRFIHRLRRIGGRYLELHFTSSARAPKIRYAGIIPTDYPLPPACRFSCDDRKLMQLCDVAQHTLECCIHEHFEDCPWREQGLYAYDSRNQALYGYQLWGNWDFVAVSFDLLGRSLQENGYLTLTAPGEHPLTIPVFTLAWISAVCESSLYSGSLELFKNHADRICRILDTILERKQEELYLPGTALGIWNFCEWVPGLDEMRSEYQAPFNLYLYEALTMTAKRLQETGKSGKRYRDAAKALGKALEKRFWDEEAGCYRSAAGQWIESRDPVVQQALESMVPQLVFFHEHIQALFLCFDLVPEKKKARVIAAMESGKLVRCTYSSWPFLLRAMLKCTPEERKGIFSRMTAEFEAPLAVGSSTLWETGKGTEEFEGGGASCCHGWSALPLYFTRAVMLGVTPTETGFRRFQISPYPAGFARASGEIPTPHGPIRISWKCSEENRISLTVRCPGGCDPKIVAYPEYPVDDVEIIREG